MGRIGASLSGFERRLLSNLNDSNSAAAINALRISTGLKINAPRDNPTGFIAVDQLTSRLKAVTATLRNVTAASSIVSQAQTKLDSVRTQLGIISTELLKDVDDSLTAPQKLASQAIIDAAIDQINTLATSKIDGKKVLDGSATFGISAINPAQISFLDIATLGNADVPTISGTIDVAAERGTLKFEGHNDHIEDASTITLTGKDGSVTDFDIASKEKLTSVRDRINAETVNTGITAVVNGSDLDLTTVDYGVTATIAVVVTSGDLPISGGNGDGTAQGVDAQGTINGQALTATGRIFQLDVGGLNLLTLEVVGGFSGALDTISITRNALSFALSTDVSQLSKLSIGGVQSGQLGGVNGVLSDIFTGGSAAGLGTNTAQAILVVNEALDELTRIDGAVDGFANAAVASADSLYKALQTDLQDSIDDYNKADTDAETILLAKNQALASNTLSALAILNQQRANVIQIIKQIAGLA